MAKTKNVDDLNEVMAEQLDRITSKSVSDADLMVAGSVANMVGKSLKLAALQIQYREHIEKGGDVVDTLEKRKGAKAPK